MALLSVAFTGTGLSAQGGSVGEAICNRPVADDQVAPDIDPLGLPFLALKLIVHQTMSSDRHEVPAWCYHHVYQLSACAMQRIRTAPHPRDPSEAGSEARDGGVASDSWFDIPRGLIGLGGNPQRRYQYSARPMHLNP